jgi:hypothetical protein
MTIVAIVPPRIRGKLKSAFKRKEAIVKKEFVISDVPTGKLNAMVKNVMSQMGIIEDANEAVRRINSGEWVVSQVVRCWLEQEGVIFFTLPPTDGTTGTGWIKRLEKKGVELSKWAKDVLNSPDFKPTNGIISNIAVLKGILWNDSNRTTKNIRAEADKRNFTKPNAEVACLIREMFSDEELEAMGLWWIVDMHEPIKDSDGDPELLGAFRFGFGRGLYASMSILTIGGLVPRGSRLLSRKFSSLAFVS